MDTMYRLLILVGETQPDFEQVSKVAMVQMAREKLCFL
jgi:hypothetical protein